MSKTYRNQHRSNLFKNGERSHHNSLLREFRGRSIMGGIWLVKDSRNLIDRRDYQSDRYKRIRKIAGKKRRIYMKEYTNEIIDNEI